MSDSGIRGQSSLEFFVTYSWQFLIIAFVVGAFVVFIYLPSQVVPQSCTFALQLTCRGVEVGSNSIATVINLEASNGQQYDLSNPSIYINISQYGSVNATCVPSNVIQGADILCSAVLPVAIPISKSVRGTMIVSAVACLSGSSAQCLEQQGETYIGNFSTSVNGYTGNVSVSIALYAPSGQASLNIPSALVANVKLLGQGESGVSVVFTTNSPGARMSPQIALTDANGNATGFFTDNATGSVLVTATALGKAASNTVSVVYRSGS